LNDDVKWLISREIPRLRRYAYSLTRNREYADDLVQDCLERAIRKRHLWHRHGSIRGWLFRILYHVFLNQRALRIKIDSQLDLANIELAGQEAGPDHRLVCNDIVGAMQELPHEQRSALLLTAVEGLSYDEAAGVLGVSIGTLRSRLSRGRDRLRETYRPHRAPAQLRRVK
jgi:RNA polymerase sigma-70 factor (ECF subfamily)